LTIRRSRHIGCWICRCADGRASGRHRPLRPITYGCCYVYFSL